MKHASTLVASLLVAFFAGAAYAGDAVDVDAAKALFKKNDCTKCHSVDKTKKGPALVKIAAKYKGKPDAQLSVIKAFTTGPEVKLEDGSKETHKILDSKDAKEQKNLADWILSQEAAK